MFDTTVLNDLLNSVKLDYFPSDMNVGREVLLIITLHPIINNLVRNVQYLSDKDRERVLNTYTTRFGEIRKILKSRDSDADWGDDEEDIWDLRGIRIDLETIVDVVGEVLDENIEDASVMSKFEDFKRMVAQHDKV